MRRVWLRRLIPASLHGRVFLILLLSLVFAQFASVVFFKAKLRWDYDAHMQEEAVRQFAAQSAAVINDPAVALPADTKPRLASRDQVWRDTESAIGVYGLTSDSGFSADVAEALRAKGIAPVEVAASYQAQYRRDLVRPGEPALRQPPGGVGDSPPPPPSESFVAARLPGQSGWLNARLRSSPPPPPLLADDFLWPAIIMCVAFIAASMAVLVMLSRSIRDLSSVAEAVGTATRPNLDVSDKPTEFQEVYAAFERMLHRVDHLLSEKDVILGAIGHDLRTPLTSLRLRVEAVEDPKRREQMIALLDQMAQFLDDIVALAGAGQARQKAAKFDLGALIADVVSDYQDRGKAVDQSTSDRVVLLCHPSSIRRMLQNLINNALKYAGTARVECHEHDGRALIAIEDDGPGIPSGEINIILRPFERGETSRCRATGGSGLGLPIAVMIAKAHGGRLTVHNREAGGLRVEIDLPSEST